MSYIFWYLPYSRTPKSISHLISLEALSEQGKTQSYAGLGASRNRCPTMKPDEVELPLACVQLGLDGALSPAVKVRTLGLVEKAFKTKMMSQQSQDADSSIPETKAGQS